MEKVYTGGVYVATLPSHEANIQCTFSQTFSSPHLQNGRYYLLPSPATVFYDQDQDKEDISAECYF